jgi:hypothetical protein
MRIKRLTGFLLAMHKGREKFVATIGSQAQFNDATSRRWSAMFTSFLLFVYNSAATGYEP